MAELREIRKEKVESDPDRAPGSKLDRRRAGRRKGIYILPNLLTTACLFSGFFAIVQATKGQYEIAAIAIFVAMVMDGLDGRVARLTETSSDFGVEYDSLADMVAFGLTPALVVYEWSLHSLGKLGWLAAFLYVAATALRLARFNTQKVADKRYFQGLPSPAAAAVLAAFVWLMESYQLGNKQLAILALIVTVATALAMVSNIGYRSFKDLDLKDKVPFIGLIFLVFTFVIIAFDPPLVLFVIFGGYFLSGIVELLMRMRSQDPKLAAKWWKSATKENPNEPD
ncbi:MAG: CDP-diacylglycerol--serine O-phosphatidyltransferase [Gammaproteobacteria bacterium]|nr:CDP-diacylglycerol--serine O-phosphatidyltransferase [Gammaproteobacteria bacterium]